MSDAGHMPEDRPVGPDERRTESDEEREAIEADCARAMERMMGRSDALGLYARLVPGARVWIPQIPHGGTDPEVSVFRRRRIRRWDEDGMIARGFTWDVQWMVDDDPRTYYGSIIISPGDDGCYPFQLADSPCHHRMQLVVQNPENGDDVRCISLERMFATERPDRSERLIAT